MRQRQELDDAVKAYLALETTLTDNVELIELGEAEGDDDVIREAEAAIAEAHEEAGKRQLETLLSGEADRNDCFVEIHLHETLLSIGCFWAKGMGTANIELRTSCHGRIM